MVQIVDDTESDLRTLVEKDFGPLPSSGRFSDVLIDWLHYRARLIPQRPREVEVSPQVRSNHSTYPAIDKITHQLRTGGDLSPWLHDAIRRDKKNPKSDLLFNDWQIVHFHLGNAFARTNKINRSSNVLFAYIEANKTVLLDVKPHGSWTAKSLLRTLLSVSPEIMNSREIFGLRGPREEQSDDDLKRIRRLGMMTMIDIDDRIFAPPGMGIATSGHATRLVRFADQLQFMLNELKTSLVEGRLPTDLQSKIWGSIGVPVRLGIKFEGGQFIAYDKMRRLDLMYSRPLE